MVIKEAVTTGIPICRTIKVDDGALLSSARLRRFVPPTPLMGNAEHEANAESISVGLQLTCRILRAPNDVLLLDATLIDTIVKKHDPRAGILTVTTSQLRSVQPVRHGQPVTLSWPTDDSNDTPRQVTITIVDAN